MAETGLFLQNVIAVVWDFDKTLSPHYMQRPIFKEYGIDEAAFWREVQALPEYYRRAGIRVHEDTAYLGHILSYVERGPLKDLTNARLEELGSAITLFPGLPDFFDLLREILCESEFEAGDLRLEHYVVSTGLEAMIRGSALAPKFDGIWASSFIEKAAPPGADLSALPGTAPISHIASFLDNTTKTRALFEINKGVNKADFITVNSSILEEDRRVPFKNMIYVADGPSDIPSFSVIRKHGGLAFAVYDTDSSPHFEEVDLLQKSQRVDSIGPADYREGTQTYKWLTLQVRKIAERMLVERARKTDERVTRAPRHIPTQEGDA